MIANIRMTLLGSVFGAAALAFSVAAMPAASWAQDKQAENTQDEEKPAEIEKFVGEDEPPAFDTPEAAIAAFKDVLAKDDFEGLADLLGLDAKALRAAEGVMDTYAQIRQGAAKQVVVEELGDRRILDIGAKLWPLPFPIVKGDDGKWSFDTYAGLEEIVNRRIGENELQTIATLRAIVDAENDYAEKDHDGDGVLEYAQKLISSEGAHDGLYWPAGPDEEQSPIGDGINQAELDDARSGEGYFGYKYKVLTSQGDQIPGGAYDYVINGNMIGGFAVLAWPAQYAETGVNTFLVSNHGIVYQTDLGPATTAIVKYIDRFNPDDTWEVVND